MTVFGLDVRYVLWKDIYQTKGFSWNMLSTQALACLHFEPSCLSWIMGEWTHWTEPCSADLEGRPLLSAALQTLQTFSFCSPTFAASFYDHLVPRTTKHLKWKLANVYTLRCQPVWKTLVEYIMDEEISSSQWWVSNRFKQLLYVFSPNWR